jgi:glycine cleavage system pyridoxal-binding protein P
MADQFIDIFKNMIEQLKSGTCPMCKHKIQEQLITTPSDKKEQLIRDALAASINVTKTNSEFIRTTLSDKNVNESMLHICRKISDVLTNSFLV